MKNPRTLALRVTMNSVLMIAVVYLLMQSVVYFRDSLILQTADLSDYVPTVFGFIGGRVLPPLLVFGVLLWLIALPIQRVAIRLAAGEELTEAQTEQTRTRLLQFKNVVLTINLIGFLVGFFLDLVLGNKLAELSQLHRLIILAANTTAAFSYAAAQSALNNVVFAALRDQLKITSIGTRKKEATSTNRQMRLTAMLTLYAALVVQYNQWDVVVFESWQGEVLAQVQRGSLTPDQALPAYRALVAEKLPLISSRDPSVAQQLPPPWAPEAPKPADRQQQVFLLMFGLMLVFIVAVQYTVSREQHSTLQALQARIRDVVEGGGDLRRRLSLRNMDDLGELAELVNRLLAQFQTIVGRLGLAAVQTREGAQAIDSMLRQAEAVSVQVGASVVALKGELEAQSQQSFLLTQSLSAFRDAAAAVTAEASAQGEHIAQTASAMNEMAASFQAVQEKSTEAGKLTGALANKGTGGGLAVAETSAAIGGIDRASQDVLQVLGALKKIAADINLLAMNASIEAAHAGEKGAGFAVVADEVRKLANTAQAETKRIQDHIRDMAKQVTAGVERAQTAANVLDDLVQGLHASVQVSADVVTAMDQQTDRTVHVAESLGMVISTSEAIREKMTAQSVSTEAMSDSLGRALERLSSLVDASNRQSQEVAGLEASFAEVRREVDRNAAATEALQAEIARFQV